MQAWLKLMFTSKLSTSLTRHTSWPFFFVPLAKREREPHDQKKKKERKKERRKEKEEEGGKRKKKP